MRAASASSNEAFWAELEAIKAMSLGLGEPIGLAAEASPPKGKKPANQAVKTAAARATPIAPAVGTPAVSKPAAGPSAPRFTSTKPLCAKGLLMPGEDPAAFETFVNNFCTDLAAVGVVQMTFATRAAELSWKLRRLPAMEGAILSSLSEASGQEDLGIGGMGDVLHQLVGKDKDGILLRLQQYETRIERSITRCLREVKVLQLTKLKEAGLGSFGMVPNAHGQPSVGAREESRAVEASPPARGPSAARQDDGFAGVGLSVGSFGAGAVGSFGKEAVGSFGIAPHAHGEPSVGSCDVAPVVEAPSPTQGPSAACQDDGLAGVGLGLGSFGNDVVPEDAVGSF